MTGMTVPRSASAASSVRPSVVGSAGGRRSAARAGAPSAGRGRAGPSGRRRGPPETPPPDSTSVPDGCRSRGGRAATGSRPGPGPCRSVRSRSREVPQGVVDDHVGAQRPDEIGVAGAAHGGDVRPMDFASCTAKVPTPPDAPLIEEAVPDAGRRRAGRPSRCCRPGVSPPPLEAQPAGIGRHDVLGRRRRTRRAQRQPRRSTSSPSCQRTPRGRRRRRCRRSRCRGSGPSGLCGRRSCGRQPREPGLAAHDVPVAGVDGGGRHPDPHLPGPGMGTGTSSTRGRPVSRSDPGPAPS